MMHHHASAKSRQTVHSRAGAVRRRACCAGKPCRQARRRPLVPPGDALRHRPQTRACGARLIARAAAGGMAAGECTCSFGAAKVGTMLERLRMHLATERFLAERRGDWMWEAGSDYASLALARLESRLGPAALDASIFPALPAGPSPCVAHADGLTGGRR